ncbi:MAG TPA: MFS transporter [Stellaceae bacterium]|nr:MFS transporter [Stellaceae bacterium]
MTAGSPAGSQSAAIRPIYASRMAVLFLIVFIDLIGFGVVIPLLPYYALRYDASPFAVTMLMASYSLAQFVAAPILGRLSDRLGRKTVLLASLACSVLSYVWLGLADALWMLFAARLLAGAGAGNIAAAQAYIADVTPPEKRAHGMGMIGAAFGLGFTVGPAIGGVVAGADPATADLARPAFLAACLSAVAFALTMLRLKESLAAGSALAARPSRLALAKGAFARPVLANLITLLFVTVSAFAGMETTFALWANRSFGWGPEQVGWIFFYVGIVLAALQGGAIGKLARRFGEARLVVAGAAIIGAGLLGLAFAGSLWAVLVVTGMLAIGMGLLNPSVTSLVSREAGAEERGGIMGVSQSASSLARIVGPAVAGAVFSLWGRDAPFVLGALLMAGVVAMAVRLPRAEAQPT